jgi:hypothetical protein
MKYMSRFYHRLDDTSGMQGPFPLADTMCTITSCQQEGRGLAEGHQVRNAARTLASARK